MFIQAVSNHRTNGHDLEKRGFLQQRLVDNGPPQQRARSPHMFFPSNALAPEHDRYLSTTTTTSLLLKNRRIWVCCSRAGSWTNLFRKNEISNQPTRTQNDSCPSRDLHRFSSTTSQTHTLKTVPVSKNAGAFSKFPDKKSYPQLVILHPLSRRQDTVQDVLRLPGLFIFPSILSLAPGGGDEDRTVVFD